MAKDKYSDDHTIEVVGDTQTVNIESNVATDSVFVDTINTRSTGQVNISDDVEITGNLTVTSDVTINDDLTVGDNLTVNDDLNVLDDADISGTLTVNTVKGNNALFSAKVHHGVLLLDTSLSFDGADLSPFVFTGSTVIFSIDGTIESSGSFYTPNHNTGLGNDFTYTLTYIQGTTSLVAFFTGADWPVAGNTAYLRYTIWYAQLLPSN